MPNINAVLNDHIRRLAKREIVANTKATRKATSAYRRAIAALKRQVGALTRQVVQMGKRLPEQTVEAAPADVANSRLRVDGLKAHRARLELSAKDYGKLFGVSGLTIYNWENGKSKPRRSLLPRIVAARGLGKREAYERLGMPLSVKAESAGKPAGRRKRGVFKVTGEQAILAYVKSHKNCTTAEVNAAWRGEGRAGSADVLLGRLVKGRALKRSKKAGERGSRYLVA